MYLCVCCIYIGRGRHGTGRIEYREFAREFGSGAGTNTGVPGGVRVVNSQESVRLASAVVDEVKALLRANRVNLDTAFNAFDRNRDGRAFAPKLR